MSLAVGGITNVSLHLVNLAIKSLLSSWVLVVEWRQLLSSALSTSTIVHKIFHSLFVVAANFHFVQWGINHLPVDSLEFSVLAKVDLHVLVF